MFGNSPNDRMPVPLVGDIKQMTIPWLFQELRFQSKTGTGFFEYIQDQTALKVVKKVYFRNGDIVFASSSLDEDRLGDGLLRAGKLTQAQFDASTEIMKLTGKKQGAVLVDLGFIKPQDLVNAVKDQVKRIILTLFSLRMGSYRFDEAPLPMADIIPLHMSIGNLILEGVTSLEWQAIRKALPAPTTIVRPATDPSTLFQGASLTEEQKTVFSFIDGKRSLEEICGLSGVGDFNALKAMHLLLALRMAEIGEIKSDAEIEFAREAVREAVRPAAGIEATQPEAPSRHRVTEAVATREMIVQSYDALASQDHYQVLGVTVTSTIQDIKKAYFRLAKSYHPDRHFDPTMADMKSKLESLFDRIHKAYTVLSDQVRRSEYDLTATKKAAQHRQKAADGFVEKRAEGYQENYKENVARAADQFDNGLREFKTGNYWGAEEKFAWATRLDPIKAPYFYYHGICLANIPRRKHEAEESLQKAIELDPTKVEYPIELSNLYLKSNLKIKAIVVLNNALNHHPNSPRINDAIAAAGEGRVAAVDVGETARPTAGVHQKVSKEKEAQALEKFNGGMKDFKVNNFGVAVDALAAAVKLDPTKAQHHYYLGLCLLRIVRRRDEAEGPLRKALELDPAKLEHSIELANYYVKGGQIAKGLGVLNNALMRNPDSPRLKDAIKAAGGTAKEFTAEEKKGGMFSNLFKKEK